MGLHRQFKEEIQLFNAQAATGNSSGILVANYRNITIAVTATLNSSLTFQFKGSVRSTEPDFTSARSVTNVWDYIEVWDNQSSATAIAGDTGVVLNNDSVANNTRQYKVNIDYLHWFALEVSAYTDGAISAWITGAQD